jgi:hypothetical protein
MKLTQSSPLHPVPDRKYHSCTCLPEREITCDTLPYINKTVLFASILTEVTEHLYFFNNFLFLSSIQLSNMIYYMSQCLICLLSAVIRSRHLLRFKLTTCFQIRHRAKISFLHSCRLV